MKNDNLFAALRSAFPADLDATAIETADGPGAPRRYSWRDLDRATAMIANLLRSLDLPAGSRVAAQTEKSVEALMLYLGVLRAGYVYLPLNTAYQAAEKNKVQGAMDFCVFSTMALTSFASGALVTTQGWTWLNVGSLLPVALIGAALVWLASLRRRAVPAVASRA